MQRLADCTRAAAALLRSRLPAVMFLSVFTALCVLHISEKTNAVLIRDEESTILSYTFKTDVGEILEDQGIVTLAADEIHFSGLNSNYGEINITRAYPVTLEADGVTQTWMTTGGTVADAFYELDVDFDSNDIIQPPLGKQLEENESILLQRVEYVTRTEEEVIPHDSVVRPTSLLRTGSTRMLQEGEDGAKTLTYMERTVDGVAEETELIGEIILKTPVTEEILVGDNVAVSPLDFGVETDAYGRPTQYLYKLTNQVATGYSAGDGAWGASGRSLSAGTVAVDPSEIPYGTKLYICSADNSFIYGYAVAADTGTGLVTDLIDVDLYYDSYLESVLNGRRIVDIYVLG